MEFMELNIDVNCVVRFALVSFPKASNDKVVLMCLVSLVRIKLALPPPQLLRRVEEFVYLVRDFPDHVSFSSL